MNPNVISKPDFQKAEKELSEEHRKDVERRLGEMSIKDFLMDEPKSTETSTESPEKEDLPLSKLFDVEEIYSNREPDSNQEQEPEPDVFTLPYELSADELVKLSAERRDRENGTYHERMHLAKEAMRGAIKESFNQSAREYFKLEKAEAEGELLLKMAVSEAQRKNPNALSTRNQVTDYLRNDLDDIRRQCEELSQSSPEAYMVSHGYELRSHVREIEKGEIVTTPYVEEHLARLEGNMAEGRPTFIHGHLGSGKTELAIMAAKHSAISEAAYVEALKEFKEYQAENPDKSKQEKRAELSRLYRKNKTFFEKGLIDGDSVATERFAPLVISGSKDLTSQDLYTDKTLKLTKFNGKPLLEHKKDLDGMIETWRTENKETLANLSPKERAEKERTEANKIIELYKMKNQAFGTEVETIKQALYRGVEEGRPVIMDEVNAIPTAVLISMNDILQRRPGQSCYIPGVGQTKIKNGFSVTMTGNLTSNVVEYGGTEDLNPAFLSRLDVIEHDYLPMSETDNSYEKQADPKKNELFQAIVTYLVDRQGNLELPEMKKSLNKIFALSQLAHQTQLVFEGKWKDSSMNVQSDSGENVEPRLEKSVLSIRNVLNVLKEWDKGSEKNLDKALWDGFISNMTNANDQNLVLAMAKQYGFFQESEGWNIAIKEHGSGFTSLSEAHPGEFNFERKPMEVLSLAEMVEVLYGPKPEREIYPDDINFEELGELDEEATPEDLIEAEEKLKELDKTIKALEVLSSQCGCSVPNGENQ